MFPYADRHLVTTQQHTTKKGEQCYEHIGYTAMMMVLQHIRNSVDKSASGGMKSTSPEGRKDNNKQPLKRAAPKQVCTNKNKQFVISLVELDYEHTTLYLLGASIKSLIISVMWTTTV